jgi:hypothetical protein
MNQSILIFEEYFEQKEKFEEIKDIIIIEV